MSMTDNESMTSSVAFVLTSLGFPDSIEYYSSLHKGELRRINLKVKDMLLEEGREDDDDINEYGDACLETISFLQSFSL